jgi:hypothetical protein
LIKEKDRERKRGEDWEKIGRGFEKDLKMQNITARNWKKGERS